MSFKNTISKKPHTQRFTQRFTQRSDEISQDTLIELLDGLITLFDKSDDISTSEKQQYYKQFKELLIKYKLHLSGPKDKTPIHKNWKQLFIVISNAIDHKKRKNYNRLLDNISDYINLFAKLQTGDLIQFCDINPDSNNLYPGKILYILSKLNTQTSQCTYKQNNYEKTRQAQGKRYKTTKNKNKNKNKKKDKKKYKKI